MKLNPIISSDRPLPAAVETHPVLSGAFLSFSLLAVLPQEFVGTAPDKFLAKR
jgi:hypothetical protein